MLNFLIGHKRQNQNRFAKAFGRLLFSVANNAPVSIPAGLAGFSAVAMLLLVADRFNSLLVWSFGTSAAIIGMRLVWRSWPNVSRPGSQREQRLCDVLALLGVLLWLSFNIMFSAQQIFTNRDPAIYNNTAAWLINHDDLHIPTSDAFGKASGLNSHSAGFGISVRQKGELYAQGNHLFPALMSLAGRIVGANSMLHLNVLFGALALWVLYGFARMLARPRWALLVTSTFALSLPLIYFSRGSYTEPLMLVFAFSALTLLYAGITKKQRSFWAIAGITAGAGALTRIDGYLSLAALLASFFVILAVTKQNERRDRAISVGIAIFSGSIVALIGWLDLVWLSSGYYQSQRSHIVPEFQLIGAVVLLGIILAGISWKKPVIERIKPELLRMIGLIGGGVVILGAILLASRPFWLTVYEMQTRSTPTGFQRVLGRTFGEFSLYWVIWYMGPILTAAGILGLSRAIYLTANKIDIKLVPGIMLVLTAACLYFSSPNIFPDQIWASRRFLPVIIPGLAAYSVFIFDWLSKQKIEKWLLGIKAETSVATIATLMLVTPLFISYPFLLTRSYTPEYYQVKAICDALPRNAAVIWLGDSSLRATMPTRSICGVEAVGYGEPPDREFLRVIAENAIAKGYVPVIGVFGDQKSIIDNPYELQQVSFIEFVDLESGRRGPPRNQVHKKRSVFLARVLSNGSITSDLGVR